MNIEEIKIEDKTYPQKLKIIKDAPERIYIIGNKEILNQKGIAIVGSRDCTEQGAENARIFAANIAKNGYVIISRDGKRNRCSSTRTEQLKLDGKTIAVLAGGPDDIYPKENKELYKKIIKTGGCIVSEHPKGEKANSERFRQRNRIVSALSLGVLIVEAEARSGTSITARHAIEQEKDVFCIPSSIKNNKGKGTNVMIQKGAKLVLSPNDVIEKYGIKKQEKITVEELEAKKKKKTLNVTKIPKEYREIYKLLQEPLSVNEISQKTGKYVTEIYSKLFMMEMEGLIIMKQNKYEIEKKK